MSIKIKDVVKLNWDWIEAHRELLNQPIPNSFTDYRHLCHVKNDYFVVTALLEPCDVRPFNHVRAGGSLLPLDALIFVETPELPSDNIILDTPHYRIIEVYSAYCPLGSQRVELKKNEALEVKRTGQRFSHVSMWNLTDILNAILDNESKE